MGYIFDAMNRAHQAPASKPADAPQPAAPMADEPDTVEPVFTAPPAVAAVEPTSPPRPSLTLATEIPAAGPALFEQPRFAQTDPACVDERLVCMTNTSGSLAEEYRSIRTGLLARWQNKRHLIHTITSAMPQEGKTLTSLNLGLCLAEMTNRRTLVLEADLRMPQFARLMKLEETPGLVGLIESDAHFADVIQSIGESQMHVICAGKCSVNQVVRLLSGPKTGHLLKELRRRYDHVIIDTPPVVELADAGILGALSDEVMLVARAGYTPRNLVQKAVKILASYNAPVAGLVATSQQHPGGLSVTGSGYSRRYRQTYGKAA